MLLFKVLLTSSPSGENSNEYHKKLFQKKQNGILFGLGNIRSMGDAHGIDSKEGERWTIKETTALLYILLVIKIFNSLLEYEKGNYIF